MIMFRLLFFAIWLATAHAFFGLLLPQTHRFTHQQTPSLHTSSSDALLNVNNETTTEIDSDDRSSALSLQEQANALRTQVESMERSLNEQRAAKLQKELEAVDKWIDELLFVGNVTIDETTQMLNSVENVKELLQSKRFSQEHVNRMFDRLCQVSGGRQCRSRCSPLVSLLVDAAGKLDCVDRQDNPNKRWNGRVERELRKRLFAADWGIELEPSNEDGGSSQRFL